MKEASRNTTEPTEDASALEQKICELEQSVAESRRTEEALRESEAKFRFLSENMADVAFMVDMDLRTTYVSPSIEKILGFTPEERRTQPVEEQMPPQSLQKVFKALMEEMEREKAEASDPDRSRTIALEYFHKDGSIISLETNIRGIRDGKGVLIGFYGLSRDITERTKAEEALRRAYLFLNAIIDNVAEGLCVCHETKQYPFVNFTVWNTYMTKITGYTMEEINRLGWYQTVYPDPELQTKAIERMKKMQQSEDLHAEQWEITRADGNKSVLNISTSVVESDDGVVHILALMQDITERKRLEETLRESERKYKELSISDDLTQLYNSRYFYHQLKMEIERVERYGQPLTLLLLDLDDFKRFNDGYGHIEGDQVLMRLGQVINRCLRQTDSAYRYGGEEFTILLPMTTSADGAVTAERIRTEFKKETFSPAPGQDIHVTVSIGLAQYKPQEEMKTFVNRADQWMYQGKKDGKDRVCCES